MKSAGRLLLFILVMLAAETSGQVLSGSSFEGLRFPPRDSFVNGWASQQFWQIQPFRSSNWVQSNGSENYLKLNIKAHSGSKMALYTSNRTNSSDFMMTTPFSLNDSAICAKAVSFWIYRDSAFNTERLDVRINSTIKLSGSVLLGQAYPKSTMAPAVSAPGWYKYTFAIPSTYRSAPSYIFFNGISSSTGRSRIYMDDVSVEVNTSSPAVDLLTPYRAICPGSSTSFSVSATGVMVSYQWQVYNGSSWANIANTGIYSGAQTATLSLASATTAVNNYRYRCVVNNTCGATISYGALLSVAKRAWFKDSDGDGWGSPYASVMDCVQPAGYVLNNLDCNDTNTNNSKWNTVGATGLSAGTVAYEDIAIDGSGTPYMVYTDKANGNKVTVKKYNGSAWVTVGSAGISVGAAKYNQIVIDAVGTPYIVYADSTNSNKATVKKFNGTAWVTVGISGFSAAGAECTALAIDGDGTPYVAYRDVANDYKATVMKYNGSAWVAVGTPGFSMGSLPFGEPFMGVAINKAGQPYVVYSEGRISQNKQVVVGKQLVVMRYNGSTWETVGSSSLQNKPTGHASLAIDGSGAPYLAYLVPPGSGLGGVPMARVMKFDDTSWKYVVSPGPLGGYLGGPIAEIAIDDVGSPYLYFGDGIIKYDGTTWVQVGDKPNIYSPSADYIPSIVLDGTGVPYIYGWKDNKAVVQKLERVDIKPVITAQPTPDTICAGNNAAYKVAANNAYRYQWQVSTNGGGTFTDIINTGVYKGATTDSLTITAPAGSYNNNKYRCVLTGTCSLKDTTAVAGLTINTPPAITSQPANKSICGGSNTLFSIAATGSGLKFRWKVNTGSGWTNVPNSGIYSGATSPTLVLTSVAASYSGYKYRCQVSGACAPAVNSAAALLTVNPKVTVTNPVMSPNPAVAGQALNTIYLGYGPSTVTLSSSATGGTPGYSYSWVPVSGLSNPMLATTSVSPPATTTYTLTATDMKGCKGSAAFTIKVIDARGTNNRVVVCHNDTSKSVVTNQVATHLSHGDKLGPCTAQNKGMPNVSETEDEEDNASISRFSVLKVYPNPNTGRFIIELPVDVTGGIVAVTDMSGRSIKNIALGKDAKLEVDLGNVANGTYMVQVLNDDKRYRAIVTVKN